VIYEIELDEAQRRAEGMLVRQGYVAKGVWTNKYYNDGEKEPLWSMKLVGFDDTRVLLWKERTHWRATISVAVGKDGEFPVCEGFIERGNKDKFIPAFQKMQEKIQQIRERVSQWNFQPANTYSAQALALIAIYFMKEKKYVRARKAVWAIVKGEINAATISEALSMVQETFASSRAERLETAVIWWEVYK
jgi:hypothetical protein